jgi:FAD/FMN-containing dehydrogenase
VLRYGNSRDLVLGLEVVTPQGEIWDGLRGLRKDNTGYDLKHLYIGAEGTLGIITAAVLKLFPRNRQVETVFAAVPSPEAVLDLLTLAREVTGDGGVLAFEMISRFALDLVLKHVAGAIDPLATRSPWYVLCDLTVPRATAEAFMTQALDRGLVTDAALAGSAAQAACRCGSCANPFPRHRNGKAAASRTTSQCPCRISQASSSRRWPRSPSWFRASGRCPSVMWAMATCTSTSANPRAWTRRRTSLAGRK